MVQTAGAEHVPTARCAMHPCLGTVLNSVSQIMGVPTDQKT